MAQNRTKYFNVAFERDNDLARNWDIYISIQNTEIALSLVREREMDH